MHLWSAIAGNDLLLGQVQFHPYSLGEKAMEWNFYPLVPAETDVKYKGQLELKLDYLTVKVCLNERMRTVMVWANQRPSPTALCVAWFCSDIDVQGVMRLMEEEKKALADAEDFTGAEKMRRKIQKLKVRACVRMCVCVGS